MGRFLIITILLSACFLQVDKTPIETPKIDRQYYLNSIEVLEEAIEDQPEYLPYIVLQLSYYQRLGWPADAQAAITRAEKHLANDQDFFSQKIGFFQANSMYEQLARELKKYPVAGRLPLDLQLTFTDALIEMNDAAAAKVQLEELLSGDPEASFDFVLNGYLRLGDTLKSLDLLYQGKDTLSVQLLELYSNLELWDSIRSLYLLEPGTFKTPSDYQKLAQSYLIVDSLSLAEQLLKSDTTEAGMLLLLESLEGQFKLVSSTRVLDQLLANDPNNLTLLKRRANLSDRRGFFEAALYYYNQVINIDSTDQEAVVLLEQIEQKIAYLRQQQQEQQIMPMLGIDSLKKGM